MSATVNVAVNVGDAVKAAANASVAPTSSAAVTEQAIRAGMWLLLARVRLCEESIDSQVDPCRRWRPSAGMWLLLARVRLCEKLIDIQLDLCRRRLRRHRRHRRRHHRRRRRP